MILRFSFADPTMTTPEIETLLTRLMSSVILFRGLERDDLIDLLRVSAKVTFHAGELVFEEGYSGQSMYIVVHGQFEVFKQLDDGEAHVAFVHSGEHFGEIALVTDRPRMASVRAREESIALRLTKAAVFDQPKVALYLLKNMAASMADHLSEMNKEVLMLDMSRRKHGHAVHPAAERARSAAEPAPKRNLG